MDRVKPVKKKISNVSQGHNANEDLHNISNGSIDFNTKRMEVVFHLSYRYQKGTQALEEIPSVKDFSESFPKELSGLQPRRKVKFAIELEANMASLSKALYRIAPSTLKELKVQLQELLD